jgi:hypothetical protein
LAFRAALFIPLSLAETVIQTMFPACRLAFRKDCRQASGEAADDLKESGSWRNSS